MKKGKKFFAGLLICGLLIAPSSALASPTMPNFHSYTDNGIPCSESDRDITLHLDGRYIYTDVDPVITNGRTMVPLRAAGEALNAKIEWNQATQTATATKDNKIVVFTLNNNTYYINGQAYTTDVAPTIIQNRTMLPIRAFGEAFDVQVDWDQQLYDVNIDTPAEDSTPNIPSSANNDERIYVSKYYVESDPSDPYVGSWHKTETNYTPAYPNAGIPAETTITDYYFFVTKVGSGYNVAQVTIADSSRFNLNSITVMKDESHNDIKGPAANIYSVDYDQLISYYRGPVIGWTLSYTYSYALNHDTDTLKLYSVLEHPTGELNYPENPIPYSRF